MAWQLGGRAVLLMSTPLRRAMAAVNTLGFAGKTVLDQSGSGLSRSCGDVVDGPTGSGKTTLRTLSRMNGKGRLPLQQ